MNEYSNKEKSINLLAFLGYFAWLLLGSTLFIIPLFVIGPKVTGLPLMDYLTSSTFMEHAYVPSAIAAILGVFVFVMIFNKIIKSDILNFKNDWIKCLIIIVSGTILLIASSYAMGYIYSLFGFGEDDTSTNQESIISALNGSTKYVVIFYTVILAPIFEEIIFRKLFYNALKMNTKLPVWAIVLIISTVFAGIHVISDIESLVYFPQYFVLAFIITGAYAITKENIFVSIGLHFFNNLFSVLQILLG